MIWEFLTLLTALLVNLLYRSGSLYIYTRLSVQFPQKLLLDHGVVLTGLSFS